MDSTDTLSTAPTPTVPDSTTPSAQGAAAGSRIGCWKLTRRTRTGAAAGQVLEHRLEYLPEATASEARGRAWSAAMLAGHAPHPVADGLRWVQDDEHHGTEAVTVTVTDAPPRWPQTPG